MSWVIRGGTKSSAKNMADRAGFDDFVVARSGALLRTAYLLTRDRHLAEDLVRTALAKAWFARRRIEGDPEPYARRIMVNEFATGRRRKSGEHPAAELPDRRRPPDEPHTDLWHALTTLSRRQRAVIVLRFFDDLTEAETASVLGVSVGTVKSQTSKALAKRHVDMNVDDLRSALHEQAETVADHDPVLHAAGVHERVRDIRRRRVVGAAALTVAALAGIALYERGQ